MKKIQKLTAMALAMTSCFSAGIGTYTPKSVLALAEEAPPPIMEPDDFIEPPIETDSFIDYEIKDGNIIFKNNASNVMMSFIISSNLDYDMKCESREAIFTPKKNGRYVLTAVELCEEIISFNDSVNDHFHYFFPTLTNYVVDFSNDKLEIYNKGSYSYYSDEQVKLKKEEGGPVFDLEIGAEPPVACIDVMARGSDDLLNGTYLSFVNGQMPLSDNGDCKSYITTVYNSYSTESYFCANLSYNDDHSIVPRVRVSDESIAEVQGKTYTSSYVSGDLGLGSDDIMDMYKVKALKDGKVTVYTDDGFDYSLEIKDGIFRKASETVESNVKGDANGDGELTISDAVMLQKWLLGTGELTYWQNVDLCNDGIIDVFDFCMLKKELISTGLFKKN